MSSIYTDTEVKAFQRLNLILIEKQKLMKNPENSENLDFKYCTIIDDLEILLRNFIDQLSNEVNLFTCVCNLVNLFNHFINNFTGVL